MKRINTQFNLSVEGKTEELYFKWLAKTLNASSLSIRTVSFYIKQKQPASFVKGMTLPTSTVLYHVCDKETSSDVDCGRFTKTLSEMKNIGKIRPRVKYELAYSNISFELWLLLHKLEHVRCNIIASDYFTDIKRAFSLEVASSSEYKEEAHFNEVLEKLSLDDVKYAIERADAIQLANKRDFPEKTEYGYSYFDENPSLSIHELVKKIIAKAEGKK